MLQSKTSEQGVCGQYHEEFAGLRWVIEFKYYSNAKFRRINTTIGKFRSQPEDTVQINGYAEGLRQEYPEAQIAQFVIYCFGNQGFRVFTLQTQPYVTNSVCHCSRTFISSNMEPSIYLSAQFILENANYVGLDRAKADHLVQLAQMIAGNASLCPTVEKLHQQTYGSSPDWGEGFPCTEFGDDLNCLYLLLALDAIRQLRKIHTQRGIPETITHTTATALTNAARRYSEWNEGKLGLEDWVLRYWFNVVAAGNLYRLGRMEFIWEPFEPNIRVYRHRQSGKVQALSEEGVNFIHTGYNPFAFRQEEVERYGWSFDQGEIWTALFRESDTGATGTPISPLGYALREEITLSHVDWELVFRHGDPVLEMHIPNFASLSLDLLKDSFEQALDFFPRYHPERPFKAFSCNSWLFNTQWVDWLPATSNVLAFQRQGYLFPIVSDGLEGMYFLFGNWQIDLDKAPLDTTLRRAVIQHLKSGGQLRTGGFFLLPEEVEKFGKEPYRRKN